MPIARLLVVLVALTAFAGDVGAQTPPQPPGKSSQPAAAALSLPSPEALLVMVRSGLIALDQANKTGNYTVLHGIGGPQLQQSNPARLGDMFASLRQSGVDLQPVLVLTPQITQSPAISPQGLLMLVGFFPSRPLQIKFEVAYQPVAGYWKLAGLNVSLVPAAAEAPATGAVQAAPPPPPAKAVTPAPKAK